MGGDESQKFLSLKVLKEDIEDYTSININLEVRG